MVMSRKHPCIRIMEQVTLYPHQPPVRAQPLHHTIDRCSATVPWRFREVRNNRLGGERDQHRCNPFKHSPSRLGDSASALGKHMDGTSEPLLRCWHTMMMRKSVCTG